MVSEGLGEGRGGGVSFWFLLLLGGGEKGRGRTPKPVR